ncbi:MAG: hypothetical protein ABW166_11795 [Sedimenticola sp.]
MKIFKSEKDLDQLNSNDPAYAVLSDLAHRLLVDDPNSGFVYDPEADGFLALVEQVDVNKPLHDIWPESDSTLLDIPWEGISIKDGFFHGTYLANNQFGIIFLIPDADWVQGELREMLEHNLD